MPLPFATCVLKNFNSWFTTSNPKPQAAKSHFINSWAFSGALSSYHYCLPKPKAVKYFFPSHFINIRAFSDALYNPESCIATIITFCHMHA